MENYRKVVTVSRENLYQQKEKNRLKEISRKILARSQALPDPSP